MMSREVVSAMLSVMLKLLSQLPMGVCSTKPRSVCIGPPIITYWFLKRAGVSLPMAANTTFMVTGEGLFTITPIAPFSPCSHR